MFSAPQSLSSTMSQREEEDEGALPLDSTLPEKHDSQTKSERTEQKGTDSPETNSVTINNKSEEPKTALKQVPLPSYEQERADSPEPSSVSMRSDWSKEMPLTFNKQAPNSETEQGRTDSSEVNCVTTMCDKSKEPNLTFTQVSLSDQVNRGYEQEGEDSSEPSCVSMGSTRSKELPLTFNQQDPTSDYEQERANSPEPSCVSMGSNRSKELPLTFNQQDSMSDNDQERANSPEPSCVSMGSNRSKELPLTFNQQDSMSDCEQKRAKFSDASCVSMKDNWSLENSLVSKQQDSLPKSAEVSENKFSKKGVKQETSEVLTGGQTEMDSIFLLLEENIVCFVKTELKRFRRILRPGYTACIEGQCEDEEEEEKRSSKEAFLKLTLQFMRGMKQEELAEALQKRTLAPLCSCKLKSNLKKKFQCLSEGISKAGNPSPLSQIYTELYITTGGTAEVNDEHEVRQIEKASRKPHGPETTIRREDIFKLPPGTDRPIKTVVTKGVAGIGKTVLTQKFTLDWAEDKTNQDIQFTFPFTFRELNVLKEKKFSLVELVNYFFTETKEAGVCRFEEFQVLFIFDGLDESRLPLDFHNNEILTDVTESTSVDVLLTNLFKGKLLPSARLWITTRPAAANQIPPEFVDMVTEVRGFTDPQKEEYFRNRFRDKEQADRIISHIKTSRSLHIMCHIPVFCWVTATVLEDVLKTRESGVLPMTLTEMYIHFLVVQLKQKNVKYDGKFERDSHWNPESRRMILSLGKLAFEQLLKGNLIFYESDLTECDIDIRAASVYSGVFTQIFIEERGLYQDKVFSFVHLSVQEFLAALHVHLTFYNSGVNLLLEEKTAALKFFGKKSELLYQTAVDKALQSPNGHLDLFLRFLLGLSLPANQSLLRGLATQTRSGPLTSQGTVEHIKKKIAENLPTERSINLFHCLNELNDRSLVEEIQQSLSSGRLSADKLSPAQWSALVFILLSSGEKLDVFDLKKYSNSEEALLRLLPVVKASTKALLSCCNLTQKSCEALSKILSSQSSSLKELDLSNNDLQDSGVELLCTGLESPKCTLEVLRLSGCLITKKGCASLASALRSNPSHLKELDLSYNHPGDSGEKLLSESRRESKWGVNTLSMGYGGSLSMQPGLKKYAFGITLDPSTAHKRLILSDQNSKVTMGKEKQPRPDAPERFDYWKQLLCTDDLTGRCYWEVEWEGNVYVAVSYKGIRRRGDGDNSCLGKNDQSWTLSCSDEGYSCLHNNMRTSIHISPSKRLGVYLDWPAGTLSFYKVSSDKLTHLHTFYATFTEPVYPAFRIKTTPLNSSVSLCPI